MNVLVRRLFLLRFLIVSFVFAVLVLLFGFLEHLWSPKTAFRR